MSCVIHLGLYRGVDDGIRLAIFETLRVAVLWFVLFKFVSVPKNLGG